MAILTGHEIKMQQATGGLYIEDFSEERLNPNSYNLRLAKELLVYTEADLDRVTEIMSVAPDWAPGLPLAADGLVNAFFKKD